MEDLYKDKNSLICFVLKKSGNMSDMLLYKFSVTVLFANRLKKCVKSF